MKKTKTLSIILFLITTLFVSCNQVPREELILGKWKCDSLLYYYNGKETMIKPELIEENLTGSIYNPRIKEFNKYGDNLTYGLNNFQNRISGSYSLIDEGKILSLKYVIHNGNDIEGYNTPTFKIEKITKTELVLSSITDDPLVGKLATTHYYSRYECIQPTASSLIGTWKVNYLFTYYKDKNNYVEYDLDSLTARKFIITENKLQLVTNNQISDDLYYDYRIKGDSLVCKSWLDFNINKLDKENLILFYNAGTDLFGNSSGITSYDVWKCTRLSE